MSEPWCHAEWMNLNVLLCQAQGSSEALARAWAGLVDRQVFVFGTVNEQGIDPVCQETTEGGRIPVFTSLALCRHATELHEFALTQVQMWSLLEVVKDRDASFDINPWSDLYVRIPKELVRWTWQEWVAHSERFWDAEAI